MTTGKMTATCARREGGSAARAHTPEPLSRPSSSAAVWGRGAGSPGKRTFGEATETRRVFCASGACSGAATRTSWPAGAS